MRVEKDEELMVMGKEEVEKKEVEKLGNKLSYYKWMAKAVLGGKMPKYDHMDEKKGAGGGGCCVVS